MLHSLADRYCEISFFYSLCCQMKEQERRSIETSTVCTHRDRERDDVHRLQVAPNSSDGLTWRSTYDNLPISRERSDISPSSVTPPPPKDNNPNIAVREDPELSPICSSSPQRGQQFKTIPTERYPERHASAKRNLEVDIMRKRELAWAQKWLLEKEATSPTKGKKSHIGKSASPSDDSLTVEHRLSFWS